MAEDVLTVELDGPGSLLAQEPHLEHGGLFLPLPDPAPEAFSRLALCLRTPFGPDLDLPAQVVQLVPGGGMAVTFDEPAAARDALAGWLVVARGADETQEAAPARVTWGRLPPPAREERAPTGSAPTERGTLHDQVRAMSTREKMQLAQHGGRTERQILSRDTNKTLHVFVLKNPRLTLDEVRTMAAFPQTNPEVLKLIGENREWLQNPGIVTALVRNPKTPPTTSVRLIDRLPIAEVRRLAKSSNVPMAVSAAAKKRVIKR